MNKYINLEVILNFIPESIKEDAGEDRLLSWAFQALRMHLPSKAFLGANLIVRPIVNHKVQLENDTRKVTGVWYVDDLAKLSSPTAAKFVTDNDGLTDNSARVAFVSEKTISYENVAKFGQPAKYIGEHSHLVNNDYLNFYNDCCDMAFSVDYSMTCLTIDQSIGYAIITYDSFKKEGNNFLIPDDADFIQALAYAAETQAWRERSANKEQGAEQMYQTRLREANSYFISANGKRALRGYSPSLHLNYLDESIQYMGEISGNYKNRR